MYNILAKSNMRTMIFQGRMIKGVVTGAIIGVLSLVFLFSNHPLYALVVTVIVMAFLCFAPEKKRNGKTDGQLFIFPEKGQFSVRPNIPEYSLKEVKSATQEAYFEKVSERAIMEAETGLTGFVIWHVNMKGVQSKICISKKMPGQNLTGQDIPLRDVLNKVFG